MNIDIFKNNPYMKDTLISDGYIFTGAELMGGVSFEESVNAGEDLTIGSCVISTIEFQLSNLNYLINNITGREFIWKKAVEIGQKSYQRFAKSVRSKLVCLNGALAYVAFERKPYLAIWNVESVSKVKDVEVQPALPVKGFAIVGDTLYCLHEESPYLTVYMISGETLDPAANPSLNDFEINKIQYLCEWLYSCNVQGDTLKEYKVDLFDLKPSDLIEYSYEYIQMGLFSLDKPAKVNDTLVKVTGSDRLKKFDIYVDAWIKSVNYPIRLKDYLYSLCNFVQVQFRDSNFVNQDWLVSKYDGENISGLQVLRWIAEAAACFGRIDDQGWLSLDWYKPIDYTIDNSIYSSVTVEDYQTAPIDKVQVSAVENDIGVIIPNDVSKTNAYIIQNNPLLDSDSSAALQAVAQNIYNRLNGLSYQPYSVSLSAIPLLRAGHICTISTRKGKTFSAYIMSRSTKGGKGELSAEGNERRPIEVKEVNYRVERLNGRTNELVHSLEENTQTLTRVQETVDGVTDEMSSISQKVDSITNTVQNPDGSATTTLDSTSFRLAFKGATEGQTEISAAGISCYNGSLSVYNKRGENVMKFTEYGDCFMTFLYFANSVDDFNNAMSIYEGTIDSSNENLSILAPNLDLQSQGQISLSANGGSIIIFDDLDVYGSLNVDGRKHCVQKTANFGSRLINAYETAEYYFGDIGEDRVQNGFCKVNIEPVFLECINTDCAYQVFLTPYDQGQIYVSARSRDHFIVSGDDIPFGWELKAKRRGYESVRLEEKHERTGEKQEATMRLAKARSSRRQPS